MSNICLFMTDIQNSIDRDKSKIEMCAECILGVQLEMELDLELCFDELSIFMTQ